MTEQPLGGGAAFWAARGVRIEPEPDNAAGSDSETETESGTDTETESEARTEPEAEARTEPEPEAETETETETETVDEEFEDEAGNDAEAAADSDDPETEPETAAESDTDAEPEAGAEPQADAAAAAGFPQQRGYDVQPSELAAAGASLPAQPASSESVAAESAPPALASWADFPASDGSEAEAAADLPTDPSTDAAGEPVWQLTGGELANPLPPLKTCLEAILMVVDEPIPVVSLAQVLERPTAEVAEALIELAEEYTVLGRGFELREVGVAGDGSRTGWRVYSRADCAPVVERFVRDGQQAKLTQAALETLAVVAYRQPVSRSKVSAIRGVNCDGVMRTLLARGLVEEYGTDPETGALLYQTTGYFLERMALKSLDELPDLAPLLPSAAEVDVEDFA